MERVQRGYDKVNYDKQRFVDALNSYMEVSGKSIFIIADEVGIDRKRLAALYFAPGLLKISLEEIDLLSNSIPGLADLVDVSSAPKRSGMRQEVPDKKSIVVDQMVEYVKDKVAENNILGIEVVRRVETVYLDFTTSMKCLRALYNSPNLIGLYQLLGFSEERWSYLLERGSSGVGWTTQDYAKVSFALERFEINDVKEFNSVFLRQMMNVLPFDYLVKKSGICVERLNDIRNMRSCYVTKEEYDFLNGVYGQINDQRFIESAKFECYLEMDKIPLDRSNLRQLIDYFKVEKGFGVTKIEELTGIKFNRLYSLMRSSKFCTVDEMKALCRLLDAENLNFSISNYEFGPASSENLRQLIDYVKVKRGVKMSGIEKLTSIKVDRLYYLMKCPESFEIHEVEALWKLLDFDETYYKRDQLRQLVSHFAISDIVRLTKISKSRILNLLSNQELNFIRDKELDSLWSLLNADLTIE